MMEVVEGEEGLEEEEREGKREEEEKRVSGKANVCRCPQPSSSVSL